MDLCTFGQEFQYLRERRGITQDEVIERSGVYETRSLRKIESGKMRPRRAAVIKLLVDGLKEDDGAVIDRLLDLSGYEPLREVERARLGLKAKPLPGPEPPPEPPTASRPPTISEVPVSLLFWKAGISCCTLAAVVATLLIKDVFLAVTTILYAALYAISVLLESVYAYRGAVTVSAALLSSSWIWATSLAALWAETAVPTMGGLWAAITIFVAAAVCQWLMVRPALSPTADVPTRFQSMTGRTAHLKNTGYFLIFVFSFWALPVHCIASRGTGHSLVLCPPPAALWALLAAYFGAALFMGHTLLSKVRASAQFDAYVTLIFARAIVGLLLSVVCLIWYSSSLQ